jgi:hypothetical protein
MIRTVDRVRALTLALAVLSAACTPAAPPPAPVRVDEPFAVWPPRMPAGVDLDLVPLGKWAEYEEAYPASVTVKERVALVGKGADGNTLETTTEMPSGEKMVFATTFSGGMSGGGRLVANLFQVAGEEPMESPPLLPGQQPYPRVEPGKLVGVETVRVRAGTYRAKHYRDHTPYGEQVDYWIDDSVGPIGLIQLEAEQKQHPTVRAGFRFELVATGSQAIQQITRPARPFDGSALKKRGLPWRRQMRVGPQPPRPF